MKIGVVQQLFFCTILVVIFFALLTGCPSVNDADKDSFSDAPPVVTKDIEAGIEKYIDDKAREGGGYFKFSSGGNDFLFKLVRIHTEYLANLGPRSHFACVDLVDISGDVYDVDFFMSGEPGSMSVTETTLHKINGKPFYTWKQNWSNTWVKVPVKGADKELLGVKTGHDEFEFKYSAQLPTITGPAQMWLPYPVTDSFQEVIVKVISAPGKNRILGESKYGNKVLFFELTPDDSGKTIDIRFNVKRKEKASYTADDDLSKYLVQPSVNTFRSIAEKVVKGKKSDLIKSRALYDHVIDHISYIKHGKGWGQGDAVYACDVGSGNCTDFHAYFIALSRSIGIPARFAIGASIPANRNNGGVDGYHCWAEFYAEGKWWPVDISEADKYSSLSTYYFGHHPANRLEFSKGRHLVVEPGPKSGPINFLAYPVLEIGGQPVKLPVKFLFNRRTTN